MGCEHIFPKDWRNMPVERVLMYITDLQKNHKLYMVYHTDTNQISVGEDILITQYKDKYVINGFESPLVNQELSYLWKLCTDTLTAGADDIIKKFEAKSKKHQDTLNGQRKR
ncbi:MAG: hypothetical protein J6J82_04165 [Alphaproteobacteria bacterium]|nr:hypothetical protein [Alphaproteobacteria bacterium]